MREGAREEDRGVRTQRISPLSTSWLAWSVCLLCVALLGAGVVLLLLNGSYSHVGTSSLWLRHDKRGPGERPD